ncbi:hypothetical protein [Acinetobacter thermotolerans]|uniref:hypothetical protein n=1 Tax=Acinetobacter thermotolerans TaxID=3151487 RepID=UPI00325C0BDF
MVNTESFSIATLIYARLRRVSGRVIDAIYLSENSDYAEHVIVLAEATRDPELLRLVEKFKDVFEFSSDSNISQKAGLQLKNNDELMKVEPTEDDIYRAQVSHHYIGALR